MSPFRFIGATQLVMAGVFSLCGMTPGVALVMAGVFFLFDALFPRIALKDHPQQGDQP